MRSGIKFAALALFLAFSAGCMRHGNVPPPPEAQAPSKYPPLMAETISPWPPELPPVAHQAVKLDTTTLPDTERAANTHPRRPVRRRPKPDTQEATIEPEKPPVQAPVPAPPPQVASVQPSEMSPIGQLSTANGNANTADRRAILDEIDSTENSLNGIKRSLSSQEQKTAAQIKTFLTRARDALKADDLDGARTLSTKAHLLLEELTKP